MQYKWLVPAMGRKLGQIEEIEDRRVDVWLKAGAIQKVEAGAGKPKKNKEPSGDENAANS